MCEIFGYLEQFLIQFSYQKFGVNLLDIYLFISIAAFALKLDRITFYLDDRKKFNMRDLVFLIGGNYLI